MIGQDKKRQGRVLLVVGADSSSHIQHRNRKTGRVGWVRFLSGVNLALKYYLTRWLGLQQRIPRQAGRWQDSKYEVFRYLARCMPASTGCRKIGVNVGPAPNMYACPFRLGSQGLQVAVSGCKRKGRIYDML